MDSRWVYIGAVECIMASKWLYSGWRGLDRDWKGVRGGQEKAGEG